MVDAFRARLKPWRRRAWDLLLSSGLRLLLPLLAALPPSIALPVARRIGILVYLFSRRDRTRAVEQLSRALELEPRFARRLSRQLFARLGEGVVELVSLPRRDPGLERSVRVEGREHLERALAMGRGVLYLTGHIGNWELMAIRVAAMGYPLQVVARRVHYPRLDRMLREFRTRHRISVLTRGEQTSLEALVGRLEAGAVLGLLVDQDLRVPGMMVPFFGRAAHTPSGPALLAVRSGAPIVFGFIRREGPLRHVIRITPPCFPPPGPELEARVRALLVRINEVLEAEVRAEPAAWPWFHARWKSISRGWLRE